VDVWSWLLRCGPSDTARCSYEGTASEVLRTAGQGRPLALELDALDLVVLVFGHRALERASECCDGLSAAQFEIPGFVRYWTLVQAWVAHAQREHESIEQCVGGPEESERGAVGHMLATQVVMQQVSGSHGQFCRCFRAEQASRPRSDLIRREQEESGIGAGGDPAPASVSAHAPLLMEPVQDVGDDLVADAEQLAEPSSWRSRAEGMGAAERQSASSTLRARSGSESSLTARKLATPSLVTSSSRSGGGASEARCSILSSRVSLSASLRR
jgi:hypothetical protein